MSWGGHMEIKLSNRIYYEIISNYNLHCIHCSDMLHGTSNKISSDELLQFHASMKKNGIRDSVVTGGEPTLHSDFEKIVVGLAQFGSVLVTSNATAINYNVIKKILSEHSNVTFQISFDGVSQSVFEEIRGAGVYRQVMGIINQLILDGLQEQLGLSMTIMRQNMNEVGEMIDFARKNGIKYLHFPVLLPVGVARKKWNEIAPSVEEQIEIENDIIKHILLDEKSKTYISCNRIEQVMAHIKYEENADCLKDYTLKVTSNGDILPCPAASANHVIGNINETNIEQEIIKRLCEKELSHCRKKLKILECNSCAVQKYCHGIFCANCNILSDIDEKYSKYSCEIVKSHFETAIEEIYG